MVILLKQKREMAMTLTQEIEKKIKERIAEFHMYINEFGWSVEDARNKIINSTCYKPVIKYVQEYK